MSEQFSEHEIEYLATEMDHLARWATEQAGGLRSKEKARLITKVTAREAIDFQIAQLTQLKERFCK